MIRADSPSFLRFVLRADAAISGATGVLLAAGARLSSPWLGIPSGLLVGAGVFLVAYGLALAFVARAPWPSPAVVRAVVIGNAGWVAASLIFLAVGPDSVTMLGTAFIVIQAVAVGILAELQALGLRKRRLVPTAA